MAKPFQKLIPGLIVIHVEDGKLSSYFTKVPTKQPTTAEYIGPQARDPNSATKLSDDEIVVFVQGDCGSGVMDTGNRV